MQKLLLSVWSSELGRSRNDVSSHWFD